MSGPPAAPSLGTAISAVFRLQWKRLVRGRKARLGIVAIVLVVVSVTITRYALGVEDPAPVMKQGIGLGFFTLLVYLIPFLLSSGAIAEEVESRTFAYVSMRPVSRLALTTGKYLAGVAMAAGLLMAGLLLMHLAVFLTTPTPLIDELPNTLKAAGAILLLTLLYGAICLFWGALVTEAAGIISALHLAIFEFGLGKLPFVIPWVSMNYQAGQLAGLDKGGLIPEMMPDVDYWIPLVCISVLTLLFLGLAGLTVSTSEYRFGKA